jgi:hypothetical protein
MSAEQSKRIMLGELLLRAGVITEQQLRAALTEQKKWGGKLGSLLVDLHFLDEDTLVKALSKQLGLPRVDFSGLVISDRALEKLDAHFSEKHQVLPISYDEDKKQLVVAMADPRNLDLVDELASRTGCKIHVAIAGEKALAKSIREKYSSEELSGDKQEKSTGEERPMEFVSPLGNTLANRDDQRRQTGAAPPPSGDPVDKVKRLESLQRGQLKVLKVLVELLLEKGLITREEYRERVEQ